MKSSSLSYRPRLDGLRFVAIFVVLVEHFGSYLANFFAAGYYGVDLFFVLSGFLITGILLKNPERPFGESYRTFMGRRVLRIFPAYYLTVGLAVAAGFGPGRELFGWLVTYTYNYGAVLYQLEGHENPLFYLWSLSVEEQFYMVWPLLVLSLRARPRVLLGMTLAIVTFGYVQLTFNLVPALTPFNYTGLPNRMGSLGLGAAGAIWLSRRSLPEAPFRSLALEVLVLAALGLALSMEFATRYLLMGLCSLFLVLKASEFEFRLRPLDRILRDPRIIYVGTISYGIYLFHIPVGALVQEYLFDPLWLRLPFESLGPLAVLRWHSWALKLPIYGAATVLVAAASFRWFESPILSLKDRWFPTGPAEEPREREPVEPIPTPARVAFWGGAGR